MPYPSPLQANGGSSPLCKIEVKDTQSKHLVINCTDNSIGNQTKHTLYSSFAFWHYTL